MATADQDATEIYNSIQEPSEPPFNGKKAIAQTMLYRKPNMTQIEMEVADKMMAKLEKKGAFDMPGSKPKIQPIGPPSFGTGMTQPGFGSGAPPETGSAPGMTQPGFASGQAPPAGFNPADWQKLIDAAKKDPKLAELIKQFGAQDSQPWRRELPKDNTQLLRQLSFNAGEIGMPGGYVGAIQVPSYGSPGGPINNPNMGTYGRSPGVGEATFYQQSMRGGMAPIAAMSPLGVPEGWNPGGSGSTTLKSQLDDYLKKLTASKSGSPLNNMKRMVTQTMLYRKPNMTQIEMETADKMMAKLEKKGAFG